MTLARLLFFGLVLAAFITRGAAAVTVQGTIEPSEVNVGEEVTVTFTAQGGAVEDIQLPPVDGLSVQGSATSTRIFINGMTITRSVSQNFSIEPTRAGDFTIPSFDIHTSAGEIIHTQPLKLHVLADSSGNFPTTAVPTPSTPSASPAPSGQGPVVMPPNTPTAPDATTPQASGNGAGASAQVPVGPDGRPARVFHLITPQTTDAYVGEAIPLRIEFFIRVDSNAQQNSLPTLIGSDFLMNNLSLRPGQDGVAIAGEEYIRDTWITAISAPKAGDFPLEATRDTYWTRSTQNFNDPFGGLFGRSSQLMHQEIGSNKLVIHVHPLPDEGKPANFTGAIGKFQVSGSASPGTVGVGEPVTLHFTVSGQGNFDYVRSPTLAVDPDWKSYPATSKVTYEEESHTQATKTFEQAVIPKKNGTVTLPPASFSYFDPDTKHYVTVPVSLPSIVVTGSMTEPPAATSEASPASTAASVTATTPTPGVQFVPNRLALGALTSDLAPGYRHPWFWILQAGLAGAIGLGIVLMFCQPRPDPTRAEQVLRHASLRQEEDAMSLAVRENDAVKFFTAARHAVQLRLADKWHLPSEALTLGEIHRRDPVLGETAAPLFLEADDVMYSGQARSGLDLTEWDRRVREMLAQL